MITVDLNCDMGESRGSHIVGDDASIMPLISSANIACGFHGGDPEVMDRTVALALAHGVSIGAHPSFHDLEHFGRREMLLAEEEVEQLVTYQVAALQGFAQKHGTRLRHVKPHGALYNMSARNPDYASAIARAVKAIDPQLILFGLSGSISLQAAEEEGLATCAEVFADRSYQDDGSLTPRNMAGAMIGDPEQAVAQVLMMVKEGRVRTMSGQLIDIKADTVCIHGDTPGAVRYAKAVREGLTAAGIPIQPYRP